MRESWIRRASDTRPTLAPEGGTGNYRPVAERGFILTPTYRVRGGPSRGAPARGPRERRAGAGRRRPRWRRTSSCAARDARARRAARPSSRPRSAPSPTSRWRASRSRCPATCRRSARRLADAGVDCFEADLRFAYRWLIDRGIRGGLRRRRARSSARPGVGRVYRNPTLAPGDFDAGAARPLARHRDQHRRRAGSTRSPSPARAASACWIVRRAPGRGRRGRARRARRCSSASSRTSAPRTPTCSPAGTSATST